MRVGGVGSCRITSAAANCCLLRALPQVDVEGCELEVLRGLDAASWAATRQVVAEVRSSCRRIEISKA